MPIKGNSSPTRDKDLNEETAYNTGMSTIRSNNSKRIYIVIRKDNLAFIEAYDNLTQARSMQRHFRVPTEIITKEFARDGEACSI